jgi:hypothetical protein
VAYSGWAIVELMGHVRMAGHVVEEECFGTKMLRLDVPAIEDIKLKEFTTWVSGGSLYRVTPTTEEIAKGVVRANRPVPVNPYDVDLGRRSLAPVADAEEVADEGPGGDDWDRRAP